MGTAVAYSQKKDRTGMWTVGHSTLRASEKGVRAHAKTDSGRTEVEVLMDGDGATAVTIRRDNHRIAHRLDPESTALERLTMRGAMEMTLRTLGDIQRRETLTEGGRAALEATMRDLRTAIGI